MTSMILNEEIQKELTKKGWEICPSTAVPEGYDVAIRKKHVSKSLDASSFFSTALLIKKGSEAISYVKFQIHNPDNELFSETEDLAIEVIDERIIAVAAMLFKKNTKKLKKEGILPKKFSKFF